MICLEEETPTEDTVNFLSETVLVVALDGMVPTYYTNCGSFQSNIDVFFASAPETVANIAMTIFIERTPDNT